MNKNKKYQYILALGHLCTDINQSILSAILPFLISAYYYDYTTASLLVTASNIFGSVVQPIVGNYADKHNKPWLMMVGVFMSCIGMALTGVISNFYGLCICVVISGIGSAIFHPQAAKLVNLSSEKNKEGKGISIFSFGAKIGFTFGPIITSVLIVNFGMKGTLLFIVPSLLFAFVCSFVLKDFKELGNKEIEQKVKAEIRGNDDWKSFSKLSAVILCRSVITSGLSTFTALYFINVLSQSEAFSNTTLSIYYGVGALVALFGGSLADKLGYKKVINVSFALLLPSILLFTISNNIFISILLLIPLAIGESLPYSSLVVLGQKYLPNHTGFASGITLGLAVSVGGIICPILGLLADNFGIIYAFYAIAFMSLICLILSYSLTPLENYRKEDF